MIREIFILHNGFEKEMFKYKKGNQTMESYKWLYNLINLNLVFICIETLRILSNLDNGEEDRI